MKILTKNTDYAIRALLALSMAEKSFLSSKQISLDQNIPYSFLKKNT